MLNLIRRFGVQFLLVAMCVACGGGGISSDTQKNGEGVVVRPATHDAARPKPGKENAGQPADAAPQQADADNHEEAWILQVRNSPKVNASELLSQYKANEVAADAAYRGRIVVVKGVVGNVGRDLADSAYISFRSGERFDIYSVQAFFDRRSEASLSSLQPGQTVRIIGKCRGKTLNVILDGCQFVAESDLVRQTRKEIAAAEEERQARAARAKEAAKAEAERLERERPERERLEKERREKEAYEAKLAREIQANNTLDFVKKNLKNNKTAMAGQLHGIIKTYPGTPAADEAAKLLKGLQ